MFELPEQAPPHAMYALRPSSLAFPQAQYGVKDVFPLFSWLCLLLSSKSPDQTFCMLSRQIFFKSISLLVIRNLFVCVLSTHFFN